MIEQEYPVLVEILNWWDRTRHPQQEVSLETVVTLYRSHISKGIGRNDPCWCGSGRKFKKCHGGGN